MSYHGYQGQTRHREPYPPYADQWATHPSTYGHPSWDHAYGYHQPVTHGLVSAMPLTLATDYLHPYAPLGQYGESAWSGAPLATVGNEAQQYGYLQDAGVAAIPVYGADPYSPHQTTAHYGYDTPPKYQQAALPRYAAVPESVWSERTKQSHSRKSMAQAQITPGIDHTPWPPSEVKAIQHNTYTFNNGYSVEHSSMAQPSAEDVLVSVAGPSTSRMRPVPASSTNAQATRSKASVMKKNIAGGIKGKTQVNAKAQMLGKAVTKKRTMPPGDGPWICRVEGQIYARYWEMLRHQETTEGHDEYQGPCICVCGKGFTRRDGMNRHYKKGCRLRPKSSS